MIESTIESHVIGVNDSGDKIIEKLERIHTRKIDRKVARYVMKRRGYKKVAKKDYSKMPHINGKGYAITRNHGYFSLNWKENAI